MRYATSAFRLSCASERASERRASSAAGVPLRPSRNVKHRRTNGRAEEGRDGYYKSLRTCNNHSSSPTHSLSLYPSLPLSHHSSLSQSPHIGSFSSSRPPARMSGLALAPRPSHFIRWDGNGSLSTSGKGREAKNSPLLRHQEFRCEVGGTGMERGRERRK